MSLLVRAFPLRGSTADLEQFISALKGARRQEAQAFYAAHGVTHESWYLQETEGGPWVIGLTQVDNVQESAPRFAHADSGFAAWFKDQVRQISGVDMGTQPLGPPTRLVYDWSASEPTARMFAPPTL